MTENNHPSCHSFPNWDHQHHHAIFNASQVSSDQEHQSSSLYFLTEPMTMYSNHGSSQSTFHSSCHDYTPSTPQMSFNNNPCYYYSRPEVTFPMSYSSDPHSEKVAPSSSFSFAEFGHPSDILALESPITLVSANNALTSNNNRNGSNGFKDQPNFQRHGSPKFPIESTTVNQEDDGYVVLSLENITASPSSYNHSKYCKNSGVEVKLETQ